MLKRTEISSTSVKLSSPQGVMDIRTEMIYSEVVCKLKNEKYFVEAAE